jgi:hypothetical protein
MCWRKWLQTGSTPCTFPPIGVSAMADASRSTACPRAKLSGSSMPTKWGRWVVDGWRMGGRWVADPGSARAASNTGVVVRSACGGDPAPGVGAAVASQGARGPKGPKGRAGHAGHSRAGTWRQNEDLPPSSQIHNSPSDPEARYGKKRESHWVGYKAHLTQTCDPELPHLMVQATTPVGSASDEVTLTAIHEQRAQAQRLPQIHRVDAGSIDASSIDAGSIDAGSIDADGLAVAQVPSAGSRSTWSGRRAAIFAGKHGISRALRATSSRSIGRLTKPSVPRATPVLAGTPAMTALQGATMR